MIHSKQSGDRVQVSLQGEIDHCSAAALRQEIEMLIEPADVRRLLLDFSGVSFIDSSGIGMIIGRYKTMSAKGGSIAACGLNDAVARLYHIAGLHRIIPIVTSGGQHGEE